MKDIVVDASVVVKWYIPEQCHSQARLLRDNYLNGRHELIAPTLLPFEVINALKYSGHYESDQLVDAATTLPEYGITLVEFNEAGPIAEIALELAITIYDAAYLALTLNTDRIIYTADTQFLSATGGTVYEESIMHIQDYPG